MKNFLTMGLLMCVALCTATISKPMATTVITPVENYALITLSEAKAHLRIEADFTAEDDIVQAYLAGAISTAEAYVNRGTFTDAVLTVTQGGDAVIRVNDWRKETLTAVELMENDAQPWAPMPETNYATGFKHDCKGIEYPALYFIGLDTDDDSEYTVRATWSLTVPAAVKSACLLILGDLYSYREDRGDIHNRRAITLLRPHRKY